MPILLAAPLILFLLFLPGYFLTLALPWVKGFCARLSLSIVTSLALGVAASFGFALLRFPPGKSFLIFNLALIFILGFIARGKALIIIDEWKQSIKYEKFFFGLILLIAIGAGIFIAIPHFNYPWPIHVDEWWAIGTVQNVMEERPLNTNPYLFTEFPNYKPGFSGYPAALFDLLDYNPVDYWAYLPAVNIFLICFAISLLIFSLTGNFLAAGLFPVFLAALRSNVYILGWWFFTPFTFSFIFILPILLAVSLWAKSISGFIWGIIVFSALMLVYPPYGILTALILAPIVFLNMQKNSRYIFIVIAALAGLSAVWLGIYLSPYAVYWQSKNLSFLPNFLEKIVSAFFVPADATFNIANNFNFSIVVPFVLATLGVLGAWFLRKERWAKGLLFGAAISIANLILFWTAGISFVTFYQRNFYFVGVMLAFFAAFSLIFFIKHLLKIEPIKKSAILRYLSIFLVSSVTFVLIFNGYFNIPSGFELYYLVNQENLQAIKWLKSQPDLKGLAVLADPSIGTIITPLSRLSSKLSFLTMQNIQTVINSKDLILTNQPCSKKQEIIKHWGADIIYSPKSQNCPFLKEIYRSEHIFIYLYQL